MEENDLLLAVSDNSTVEKLLKAMRYINKVLYPAFIRDWCLKCSRHLSSTKDLYWQKLKAPKSPAVKARHVLESAYLDEREFLCLLCNAFDRHQLMMEIHDPWDFHMSKHTLEKSANKDSTSVYKDNIYKLEVEKKGLVIKPTSKVLNQALEDVFFRMVLPSDSDGPIYIGNVDPRHRFPDLSHPSQLQGYHYDVLMGKGKKRDEGVKIGNTDTMSTLLFFSRRSSLLDLYEKNRPEAL